MFSEPVIYVKPTCEEPETHNAHFIPPPPPKPMNPHEERKAFRRKETKEEKKPIGDDEIKFFLS